MYQKAMPAGSAGIMAASYGMEAILKPIEPVQEEEQQQEQQQEPQQQEPQQQDPANPAQTPNPGQE